MQRRILIVVLTLVGLVALIGGGQKQPVVPIVPLVPITPHLVQLNPGAYLAGNFEKQEALAVIQRNESDLAMFGTLGFRVFGEGRDEISVRLTRLNLVSEGTKSEYGDTGTIGLSLNEAVPVEYSSRSGEIHAEFLAVLHYGLIDEMAGFRQQECRGECDRFESFTETMAGKLTGRFAEPLEPAEKGATRFEGDITLELEESVIGVLRRIHIRLVFIIEWLFEPAEILRIQPVFVGSGPSDPNATGTVFNTLMNFSYNMWNRCGTERCLGFVVNDPIYVNNNAYRILDNSAEANAFRATVDVANAVEVFVAGSMSTSLACSWGGGACFSGGTASAKIVSCDQQMAVPNPCPPACTSFCPCGPCLSGAINPYHLAHELGHALDLPHPPGSSPPSTVNSIMEPSGFCCDNPNAQSAKNCRNAANPLLFSGLSICTGSPDIND